ncbi:MAG: hypothetical protein H0X25_13510 [Acidobacteriales bacterium]|nr:hypothetical protein [Terriglobales bacterium]
MNHALLQSVAQQLLTSETVVLDDEELPISRTGAQRLRAVSFESNGRRLRAIEQNPDKTSQWAALARSGHKVVQFRDQLTNRYVAVAVDGKIKEYK